MATSDLPSEARERIIAERLDLIRRLPSLKPTEAWAIVVEFVRKAPGDMVYLLERVRALEQSLELVRLSQPALPPPRLPPPLKSPTALRGEPVTQDVDPLREISQALLELGDQLQALTKKRGP